MGLELRSPDNSGRGLAMAMRFLQLAMMVFAALPGAAPAASPAGTVAHLTPEEAAAFAPVAALFEGIATKNEALIRQSMIVDGSATIFREGQFHTMTLAKLADRLVGIVRGTDAIEEVMTQPLVRVDHNVAVVWGAYTAFRNGKADHCGSNIVSLIQQNGRWIISGITDTSRECGAG
jgi:hypothetical protein